MEHFQRVRTEIYIHHSTCQHTTKGYNNRYKAPNLYVPSYYHSVK
jgi:hypothetical protein